jgi:Domain of unknown function (DUF4340)
MNRQRFVALLVAALLIVSLGLYLSARRLAHQETSQGGALFPSLAGELASVSSFSVRKANPTPTVTLHKKGQDWTVAERADYPADVFKLRKLLLSLADAKIVETKTADPANFPVIGVEDPSSPTTTGTQIEFTIKDGAHALIVGKSAGEGNYVRRGGENQSYSVAPGVFVETEPKSWIDAKLLDIPLADIQRIDVKVAGGPNYSVHRLPAPPAAKSDKGQAPAASAAASAATPQPADTAPPPAEPGFALDGVPSGRKPANGESVAPSSSAFSGLTADDVAQASEVDFSKPTTAALTLKDGSVITLTGVVLGDKHWIQYSGVKDAAFAAKSAGRAYQLPSYRYDSIFRPLEQLLTPKEPPPAKAGPAKPAASAPLKTKTPAKPLPAR